MQLKTMKVCPLRKFDFFATAKDWLVANNEVCPLRGEAFMGLQESVQWVIKNNVFNGDVK